MLRLLAGMAEYLLKADACDIISYSQNMPNQLYTHNISGKYIHWLVRYSPSTFVFVPLEHIEVFFLVIFQKHLRRVMLDPG